MGQLAAIAARVAGPDLPVARRRALIDELCDEFAARPAGAPQVG